MDPIRRKSSSEVQRTEGTQPTQKSASASKPFEVGPVAGQDPTQTAAGIQPNFDRIRSQIEAGLKQARSRQEILKDVVASELRLTYGQKVTPEMEAAVTEKFQSDPQLSGLFSQLFAKVKGQSESSK